MYRTSLARFKSEGISGGGMQRWYVALLKVVCCTFKGGMLHKKRWYVALLKVVCCTFKGGMLHKKRWFAKEEPCGLKNVVFLDMVVLVLTDV